MTKYFETGERQNGESYVFLKDNAPQELKDAIQQAHGERLPDNFIYQTFLRLLESIEDFGEIEDYEDVRHEIVDGLVDPYTSNLTKWLNDSNLNVHYLTEAMEEGAEDGFQLLMVAQYKAIDEIYSSVVSLLEKQSK